MNKMQGKGPQAADIRRIASIEQQMDRLAHPDRTGSDAESDAVAAQMALFDARWNGVIPASAASPPADTSPRGRAKAVEAYRCGVLAERKAAPDNSPASKAEPEESPGGEAQPGEEAPAKPNEPE